jgi:hypothetical protein
MNDRISKPAPLWRAEAGIISFPVTSDATAGDKWIPRSENQGFSVGYDAKSVLRSRDFKLTPAGVTLVVAVLTATCFSEGDLTLAKAFELAEEFNFTIPNTDIACLIREKFSDEDIELMGQRVGLDLWHILTMHEPIRDQDGLPSRLLVTRQSSRNELILSRDRPGSGVHRFPRDYGFAFIRSQVGPQT